MPLIDRGVLQGVLVVQTKDPRNERALHEVDFEGSGFQWVDCQDANTGVLAFLRRGRAGAAPVLVVCNLTPVPRLRHRVGVPHGGWWRELANSDAAIYGGSGLGNLGGVQASGAGTHGQPNSLECTVPPLAVVFFRHEAG